MTTTKNSNNNPVVNVQLSKGRHYRTCGEIGKYIPYLGGKTMIDKKFPWGYPGIELNRQRL